jgi:hypothetical protein
MTLMFEARCRIPTAGFFCFQMVKTELIAHQISKRKGELFLRLAGDRIYISGQAVTISKGELCT